MRKLFSSKDKREGDALITTIVSLLVVAVFLLGYLNIASKRIDSYANFNKYVDMKTSMANAMHAALVVAIDNYDDLSDVATELDSLDSDESLKAIFSDVARHYPFLNESSPTIFSDVQYLNTVNSPEDVFKTAYGYPRVYYLKMDEEYQDVIISTIKKADGRIMNYLMGNVEKEPFFDELRKKVYIINDSETDPNKKSRFLPEEEFGGALMTSGNLFFNDFRGRHGPENLDDYDNYLYWPISLINSPSEIPTAVFTSFVDDFNQTIVASGSEFLWVGEGNNSTSTMSDEEIVSLFATDTAYRYVGYDWEYLGNNLATDTINLEEDLDLETQPDTVVNYRTGLKFIDSNFESGEFKLSSAVENGYTKVTVSGVEQDGKNVRYEIYIHPPSPFSTPTIYTSTAVVKKYVDDTQTATVTLNNFNGNLYFGINNSNNDLIIDGDSTNYSNVDLKILTNDSIKFEQNFLVYGMGDINSDTALSLSDPILSFVADKSIKFLKKRNGRSDETYKISGSLYALTGALAFVGNGSGELNLYVLGQVVEGITIEHIGQGFGRGTKRDIPDIRPNEYVGGSGSLKNDIIRHFYYDPRLWFVDYFEKENIKRIFIPRYSINGNVLNFMGTYGSVIVKLNYMGW